MTRYEAHITKDWESIGLAHLIILRVRDDGATDYGAFFVDVCCLGVKDASCELGLAEDDIRGFLRSRLPSDGFEAIHPACARKLIEGAVAYAESLGFTPHRDYRKARKVLSGLDASSCPRDFTFGRDGRPCYVQGEMDTPERVDRVLAVLKARCGPDGFDYVLAEEEDDDVRVKLMDFLENEPVSVPRFFELSGLLTAMLVCPTPLSPLKAIDVLWGPDGRSWQGQDELAEFTGMLTDYWNHLADRVAVATAPRAPATATIVDLAEDDLGDDEDAGLAMAAICLEWSRGFLRATRTWPEAWDEARARPDLAPHWEVLGWWAGFHLKENRDAMVAAAEAASPRTLGPSVTAIARALRPPPPT